MDVYEGLGLGDDLVSDDLPPWQEFSVSSNGLSYCTYTHAFNTIFTEIRYFELALHSIVEDITRWVFTRRVGIGRAIVNTMVLLMVERQSRFSLFISFSSLSSSNTLEFNHILLR